MDGRTRSSRVRGRRAALLALCAAAACRSYAPVAAPEVGPGTPVRVRLTDRGSVDLATALGPRASTLGGRVTERQDSTLVLRVASVTRLNGVEEGWQGETVRLPLGAVARVERERVSTVRSVLLVGGVAAALAVIASALDGGSGSVRGGPGGGTPGGSQ